MQPKICTICNGLCRPLFSDHNPPSSEWYCEKCNKSHPMTPEEFQYFKPRGAPAKRG